MNAATAIDLSTPHGRKRARRELVWGDHGFLRVKFRNLHAISDEMFRANQPSPEQIARYAKELGLKTILNLRGDSPKGYYLLEKEACERHGITLVDFQMFSREIPKPEAVLAAKQLFDSIAYPALMHCKSGADRAGIMSVLYMHFRLRTADRTGAGTAVAQVPAHPQRQDRRAGFLLRDLSGGGEAQGAELHPMGGAGL